MANKHRGEVALSVDGATYTMRLSANALCDLEGVLQCNANQAFAAMGQMEIRAMRAILWASLTETKPGLTLAGAGEIMDAAGLKTIAAKLGELVAATFPQADAGEASTENPQ